MKYDVAVIGAGVIGSLTARALSRYQLNVVLLEATNDVAMGSSKANSGIVHAGFDAIPGTMKAKFNVRGTAMMAEVCKKLNVPYKNNGSLVVAFSDEEMNTVRGLYERGLQNHVPQMEILDKEALKALEPNLSDEAVGALYAKSAGIVCPYELTIAATENAVSNGAEFRRNFRVNGLDFADGRFLVTAESGESLEATLVINAAGVYSDRISALAGDDSVQITVRRGEYFILDKTVGDMVSATIFQCPTEMGKGVLVSPTVDGNLLIGPTSTEDCSNKDDTATTLRGLRTVKTFAVKSCPDVSTRFAITSFSGLRAHPVGNDFVLGPSKVNAQFIQAAGIESPGLSASPAIAEYLADVVCKYFDSPAEKPDSSDCRPDTFRFRHATDQERAEAIKKNPAYGRIVCRCESITEGEILDAIHAPAGARDVDGVKRRTRAGMGRCQGGFCGSKVVELLAKELGCSMNEITKFGDGSKILFERTK